MTEGNKPVAKYRAGQVTATVWKNTKQNKAGEDFDAYSVSIVKQYKDGEEWKDTNSYQPDELANIILVASEAQRKIKLKE